MAYLEPCRCEDIKGIVAPEIGPKSFGTFEKQAIGFLYNVGERDAQKCLHWRTRWALGRFELH